MLADIVRFNRRAKELLLDETGSMTLLEFGQRVRFSQSFWDNYLIPMGAAIWSAPPHRMLEFPARHFVQFCANHGLLSLTNRPQWSQYRAEQRDTSRQCSAHGLLPFG